MSLGTLVIDPPVEIPRSRQRRRGFWRGSPRKLRCPFCLEILGHTGEGLGERTCPICRHRVPENLQETPPHLFSPTQRLNLFLLEVDYIWDWEYRLLQGFRHTTDGCGPQFSEAKAEFEALNQACHYIRICREEFLEFGWDMDLEMVKPLMECGQGGNLARDLLAGRPFREAARNLSPQLGGSLEITEFQWDLVKATSWGAFGYSGFGEKKEVLRILETRMTQQQYG